mgnify:CR=1 FL=1
MKKKEGSFTREWCFYIVKIVINIKERYSYLFADQITVDENLNISGLTFKDENSLNAYIKSFKKKSFIDHNSEDYVTIQIPLAEIRPRGSDYCFKSNKRGFMNECMDIKVRFIFGHPRNNLIDIYTFHHSHWKNGKATKLGIALFNYVYSQLNDEERKIVDRAKWREYNKQHSQAMQLVAEEERIKQEKKEKTKKIIGGGIKVIGNFGKDLFDVGKEIVKTAAAPIKSSSNNHEDNQKDEYYSGLKSNLHPADMDWGANKVIYKDDEGNYYQEDGFGGMKKM